MLFHETNLKSAYIIDLQKHEDDRGFFARSWCQREFTEQGLSARFVQCNISFNKRKGTVRGMHYQLPPCAEEKLVRVTRGCIFDVIVDLRPDSATFLKCYGIELTRENHRALYVPKGFAHGFQTLDDDTEVFYQMSEFYAPEQARGLCWDDPLADVQWPLPVAVISRQDQSYAHIDIAMFDVFRCSV
jgi:dTDP-4-dehydrorhamnose 3,5-epimerase